MAKLVLPKSTYDGIPGVKKCQKLTSPEYEKLAEEATKRIRKNNCSRRRLQKMRKIIFANNVVGGQAESFRSSLISAY